MSKRTRQECRDIVLGLLHVKPHTRTELRTAGKLDQKEVGHAIEYLKRTGAIRAVKPLSAGVATYEIASRSSTLRKGPIDWFDDVRFDALLTAWGISQAGPALQRATSVSRVMRLGNTEPATVPIPQFKSSTAR